MIEWIKSNIEWLFSGIGVAIISFVIYLFRRNNSQKQIQKSGNDSINIQVGNSLNIDSKETDDERTQEK